MYAYISHLFLYLHSGSLDRFKAWHGIIFFVCRLVETLFKDCFIPLEQLLSINRSR